MKSKQEHSFFDFDSLEQFALEIGLTLDEFWGRPDDLFTGMTIREFGTACKAHHEKEKKELRVVAWQTAHLMNIHIDKKSKAVTVEKLLGEKKYDPNAGHEISKLLEPKKNEVSKNAAQSLIDMLSAHNAKVSQEESDLSAWESDK